MKEDSSRELMQGQCLQSVEEVAAKLTRTFIMYYGTGWSNRISPEATLGLGPPSEKVALKKTNSLSGSIIS